MTDIKAQEKVMKAAEIIMQMMEDEGKEFFGYSDDEAFQNLYNTIEDVAYNAEMMIATASS
jgi:hypothetical protein